MICRHAHTAFKHSTACAAVHWQSLHCISTVLGAQRGAWGPSILEWSLLRAALSETRKRQATIGVCARSSLGVASVSREFGKEPETLGDWRNTDAVSLQSRGKQG